MNIDNLTDKELQDASEWIMENYRNGITARSAFVASQLLKDELEKRNCTTIEKQELALRNLRDAVEEYQAAGVVLNSPGWADSIAKGCEQIAQSAAQVCILQD